MLKGMQTAHNMGVKKLILLSDNVNIIWNTRESCIYWKLSPLLEDLLQPAGNFEAFVCLHVNREIVTSADLLAKNALQRKKKLLVSWAYSCKEKKNHLLVLI